MRQLNRFANTPCTCGTVSEPRCTGTAWAVRRRCAGLAAAGRAAARPDERRGGLLGRRLRAAARRADCSGSRTTTATPDARAAPTPCTPAAARSRSTPQRTAVPAVQHDVSAGRRQARRYTRLRRRRAAGSRPDRLLAHRPHVDRADQRVDNRVARRRRAAGTPSSSRCSGCPAACSPTSADPGAELGPVLPDLADRVGPHRRTARHHRGLARHRLGGRRHADERRSRRAYISCGTWALVGVELGAPVVTADARAANFTNEVGVDGRIRFLRNVMGLWLLSESVRHWERDGSRIDLAQLLEQAAACPPPAEMFDGDDPRFVEPGDMPGRIRGWYTERGLPAPANRPGVGPRHRGEPRGRLRPRRRAIRCAHGGSGRDRAPRRRRRQERLLCQLVADRIGRPVIAGPVEATAIGNVLVQARATACCTVISTISVAPWPHVGRDAFRATTGSCRKGSTYEREDEATVAEQARPRGAHAVQEAGVRCRRSAGWTRR